MRNSFLRDLRDNHGYYYTDGHINLNDFVLLIAGTVLSIAFIVVYFIFESKSEDERFFSQMITIIVGILFSVPIAAHFIIKTVRMLRMKSKIKKYQQNGRRFMATIIEEKKGKQIFYDNVTQTKKYAYFPMVQYYDNGKTVNMTSRHAFSNSYKDALSSKRVIIFVYNDDFIITEAGISPIPETSLKEQEKKHTSLDRVFDTMHKRWVTISLMCYAVFQVIIFLLLWHFKYSRLFF